MVGIISAFQRLITHVTSLSRKHYPAAKTFALYHDEVNNSTTYITSYPIALKLILLLWHVDCLVTKTKAASFNLLGNIWHHERTVLYCTRRLHIVDNIKNFQP